MKVREALNLIKLEKADLEMSGLVKGDAEARDNDIVTELKARVEAQHKIIDALQEQLAAKRKENERLRDQIANRLPSNSQGRLSRWQHLKAAFSKQ